MDKKILKLRDTRRKHFFTVDNEIFDMNLSVYALAVYFYLCRCVGDKSYAFPSLNTIRKSLSISKDRILKSLKELEEKNIIRRERRFGEKGNYQSTVYVLIDKSAWNRSGSSDRQGVVCQTDKGRSPDGQGVVRETDKGCPPDGHKEKIIKKTQIEEKITERDICRELPREEKLESPKETNLEKRGQAGGEPFDGVKERQPETSANRLPKQLYISPHAKQIVNAFKDQFLTKFGIPPTITTKAVQELEAVLSRLSDTEKFAFVERAAGAIERYLKSDEPFLKKAGYSFQVFVSTMQKYMLEEKKEEKLKSERKDGIIEEMDL